MSAVFCQSVSICSAAPIIVLPNIILCELTSFSFIFLVLSVWRYYFCILSFLHSPASIGLWSALCPGFSLFVCSSLHGIPPAHLCSHPALLLDLSVGCLLPSRRLSAPPARLKPVSVRHAVEVNFSPSVNASWLIFGTEFLVFVV